MRDFISIVGNRYLTRFSQAALLTLLPCSMLSAALEEVIVTAQKREQNLQDVPMAVTAVGRELLENNEINTLDDLTKLVPSLRLTPDGSPSGGSIRIRGVGTNVFSSAVEPNVLVMLDGVPLARNSLANFEFADIERIEVLRGPQGTLFGKNASAGLIHVVTRDPAPEFEARVRFSYEQPDEFAGNFAKTQFTVSGPIADDMGLRITGFGQKSHGHIEDILQNDELPDVSRFGLRGKLRWDPSDTVAVRLVLEMQHTDAEATPVIFRSGSPELKEKSKPLKYSETNRQTRTFGGNLADSSGKAAAFSVDWELADFIITSVTAYRDADNANAQSLAGLGGDRVNLRKSSGTDYLETITQELRLSSTGNEAFEYTIGALWFDNFVESDGELLVDDLPASFFASAVVPPAASGIPSVPIPSEQLGGADSFNLYERSHSVVGTENLGLFAEGTWHFSDAWHITAGARYIDEVVSVTELEKFSRVAHTESDGEVISSSYTLNDTADVHKTAATGRLSALYNWSEELNFYGTIATGYRGAAFDLASTDNEFAMQNPVDPEKALSYELGMKSRLFDNSLELNVTAFITYFKDFQAQIRDLESDVSIASFRLDNAGELETRGVEFEFHYSPNESLSIVGSYLFNRAVFNEFITQCYAGQGPNEGGAIDEDGDGACDANDVSGGILANAPKRSASLSGRYEHILASGDAKVYTQLSGRWQDKVQFANEQHPLTTHKAYSIWDLRAGYLAAGDKMEIAAYVENVFAQNYVGLIVPLSLVNDKRDLVHNIPVGADRIFGVSMAYNW